MPRTLNSFLIRWWHGDDSERLELEHIQSGRKQLAASIEDAIAWLKAQQTPEGESAPPEIDEAGEPRSK